MQTFLSSESQAIEKHYWFLSFLKIVNKLIIFLISLYQKYVSPFKGFSCAYRILHNDESCSCYVKRMFLEQDLMTAIHFSRQRFRECSDANYSLRTMSKNHEMSSILMSSERGMKKEPWGRRKFVQNMFLGFTFPMLDQVRFECCSAMCAGPKKDDNQNK